jgi:hypothetical protein
MQHRSARALALAVFVAMVMGCSGPTSILLRITSPLAVPAAIDGLSVSIHGDTTGMTVDRQYPITSWPQTISLRPGPMESSHLTITITGTHGRTDVVRRIIPAMFVTGTQQTIDVLLPAECAGVMCADGQDCQAGRCVGSSDGGPGFDGGDGGAHDAGVDVGTDAWNMDTGPTDAGCSGDMACDDHVACTHDTCVAGACVHMPDDMLCQAGHTCSLTAGCPPRTCAGNPECQDGVFCNGMEQCSAMSCVAATTSACDDGDACTTDGCTEASMACTHNTRDADMDGYGDSMCPMAGTIPNTDCNDAMPGVHPGAPDICNGVDDDCDGMCDQNNTCCSGTMGTCMTTCGTTGTRICSAACSWSVCAPPPETCNGADDD